MDAPESIPEGRADDITRALVDFMELTQSTIEEEATGLSSLDLGVQVTDPRSVDGDDVRVTGLFAAVLEPGVPPPETLCAGRRPREWLRRLAPERLGRRSVSAHEEWVPVLSWSSRSGWFLLQDPDKAMHAMTATLSRWKGQLRRF